MRIEQMDIKHQLVAMILLGINAEDSGDIEEADATHDSVYVRDSEGHQYLIKITQVD